MGLSQYCDITMIQKNASIKGMYLMNNKNKSIKLRLRYEKIFKLIFILASFVASLFVALITLFVLNEGLPLFKSVSFKDFIFNTVWKPTNSNPSYGILSFILSSLECTLLSLLFAFPLSLLLSIYLEEMATKKLKILCENVIEILQGIPSVIFGLVGMSIAVPFVRKCFGGNGYSILTASLVLSIMIMPTLVNIINVSISSVSTSLKEGSYALGATDADTIMKVVLRDSRSGIITAVILAVGRAVGETTAVLLVMGNAPLFPHRLTSMSRTLTMNIVTDMSYAEGTHMNALFATGMVLLVVVLALNSVSIYFVHKKRRG